MDRNGGRYGTALTAVMVVLSVLVAGTSGVHAKADHEKVEEVPSGTQAKLLGVAWNPCSMEAIIVGELGMVMRFTEQSLDRLTSNTTYQLSAVAWKPDCSEALIVGAANTILRYKDGKVTPIEYIDPDGSLNLFQDVTWNKDGNAVIAAGMGGVIWYDGTTFKKLALPVEKIEVFGIAWKPNGDYGLLVGQKAHLFKVTETSVVRIATSAAIQPSTSFYSVGWRPDGSTASIVGQKGTILEYDGEGFIEPPVHGGTGSVLTFLDVDWRPDNEFSLIVGDTGTLLVHAGGPENFPHTPMSGVYATLYATDWSYDGKTCLIVGQSGVVLLYPGKAEDGSEPSWNPVAIGAIIGLGVLIVCLMAVYYVQDRQGKKRKERESRKRRKSRRKRKGKRFR